MRLLPGRTAGRTAGRDAGRRQEEVVGASLTLALLRRPPRALWDDVVLALADGDVRVACAAPAVLAEAGPAVAAHGDRLAAFLERREEVEAWAGDTPTTHVLLSLAGIGDRRATGPLRHRLSAGISLLLHRRHAPTLRGLPAGDLLPALPAALRRGPHPLVLELLRGMGAAAAPVVPDLLPLLATDHAREACEVLGGIGPSAAPAAGALADLARGSRLPPRCGSPRTRWHGLQTAAWAHWRVTGDPGHALRVIGTAVRAGLGHPVLRYVGDLGPLADRYAHDLLPLLDAPGAFTRVEAAHAWWRVTGDPGPAVPVLIRELAPLRAGLLPPSSARAVRHLGAIGEPAAAAAPELGRVLAAERRNGRGILEDEALCRSLTTALAATGR
ncbi:hypothetical protein ACFT5C_30950 [Streptomyces sp. NPDC057116]|uniref:hypothetical protein n=1 Tax=Streptomyces sp. NPDC057116 TaxID=3346023 RepID=UPI003639E113